MFVCKMQLQNIHLSNNLSSTKQEMTPPPPPAHVVVEEYKAVMCDSAPLLILSLQCPLVALFEHVYSKQLKPHVV